MPFDLIKQLSFHSMLLFVFPYDIISTFKTYLLTKTLKRVLMNTNYTQFGAQCHFNTCIRYKIHTGQSGIFNIFSSLSSPYDWSLGAPLLHLLRKYLLIACCVKLCLFYIILFIYFTFVAYVLRFVQNSPPESIS